MDILEIYNINVENSYKILHISCMISNNPDSKVFGANMGSTWGWQDSGRTHVGPTNLAIWVRIAMGEKDHRDLRNPNLSSNL